MRREVVLTDPSTELIWSEFGDRLRAFFRTRLRNDQDAEDLLHETFARIHEALDSVRNREAVSAWLWRIARNVLTDRYRRHHPSAPLPSDLEVGEEAPEELNGIVASWLGGFMETLPENYRQAVEEADLKNSGQRDMAQRLGLSVSAFKSRVQRGRRMLLKKLLDCCHLEFDRRGNVVGYRKRQAP